MKYWSGPYKYDFWKLLYNSPGSSFILNEWIYKSVYFQLVIFWAPKHNYYNKNNENYRKVELIQKIKFSKYTLIKREKFV